MSDPEIRPYRDQDAEELTTLLHLSYAELGRQGLNFTAVDQDVETTRYRARLGQCWLMWRGDELVATLTISHPPSSVLQTMTAEARVPQRAWLNQMGVHPHHRGQGLSSCLWATGQAWARAQGASSIGVDTAAPATHLRALYARWGFTEVDIIHWEGKVYDSIVMTRPL